MEEIFEIADRVTVLRDGVLIRTLVTAETTPKEMVSFMVGREFNNSVYKDNSRTHEKDVPLLEVKGLSSGKKVNNVNFSLYPGEILALTGLVGAGRSEVVQTIFGMYRKDCGEILMYGEEIEIKSPYEAIKKGLGLVPEDRKLQGLFPGMSVRENITIANLPNLCRMYFIMKGKESEKSDRYIETLRVKTPMGPEQKVRFLSGGNQQKTIIARWLLNNPKVLFLDEPTHGVDIGAKAEIYEIIQALARDGVGIVLISSELPEVLMLADRILIMYGGSIAGELTHNEATQELIMEYATNQRGPILRQP